MSTYNLYIAYDDEAKRSADDKSKNISVYFLPLRVDGELAVMMMSDELPCWIFDVGGIVV